MSVHGLTRRITLQTDVPSILRTAVDGLREVLGADVAVAAVAGSDRGSFAFAAASGATTDGLHGVVLTPMAGLGGRVASLRRPVVVDDYPADRSISREHVDAVAREGLRGVACVPVLTAQGVAALLYVGQRRPSSLTEQAINTLAMIGTVTGVAIDQSFDHARQREFVALRERQRLASTLHDSVAQTLFAIGVEARRSRGGPDDRPAEAVLARIATLAAHASAELRETLHQINEIPARMSLAVALDAEARAFERLGDLTVRVVTDGVPRPAAEPHETLICDTVHEGVRNAVKHAQSRLVVVHLRYGEGDIGVTIQSDSPGALPGGEPPRPRGGLQLLRSRAEALRGRLEFVLGEEGEAIVRLVLPDYQTTPEGSRP